MRKSPVGPFRIQLWSWNYAPEPTAMGPIATLWAEGMAELGHDVSVVTAFPHYPPIWRQRSRPYRERRNGIRVLRLPLLIGHASTKQRVLEEVTYAASTAVAAITSPAPDAAVVVSPSFLALQPVLRLMRMRHVPTVLWLQDILPEAAATTGLVRNRHALGFAQRLERAAYRMTDRIVVISETFRRNLIEKGVPDAKIAVVYNPATRGFTQERKASEEARILSIGNIGHSQGLARFVRAFVDADPQARLVITGTGEEADSVEAMACSNHVDFLGLVSEEQLDEEMTRASLGLVTQRPDVREFNVPSKLMTMMARGLPILAFVRHDSEVERIVRSSGGGWVVDCAAPERLSHALRDALEDSGDLARRGRAAASFAKREFTVARLTQSFERLIANLNAAGST